VVHALATPCKLYYFHRLAVILFTVLLVLQADEAYVLPVLLRFDGHPEVDEQVSSFIASLPYIMFFMSNVHQALSYTKICNAQNLKKSYMI